MIANHIFIEVISFKNKVFSWFCVTKPLTKFEFKVMKYIETLQFLQKILVE